MNSFRGGSAITEQTRIRGNATTALDVTLRRYHAPDIEREFCGFRLILDPGARS